MRDTDVERGRTILALGPNNGNTFIGFSQASGEVEQLGEGVDLPTLATSQVSQTCSAFSSTRHSTAEYWQALFDHATSRLQAAWRDVSFCVMQCNK